MASNGETVGYSRAAVTNLLPLLELAENDARKTMTLHGLSEDELQSVFEHLLND